MFEILPTLPNSGADLFLSVDFLTWILLLCCCTLESTTQWRLSTIKVKLELELSLSRNNLAYFNDHIPQLENSILYIDNQLI